MIEPQGKCPGCGAVVATSALVKVATDINATKLYGPLPAFGLACICPSCKVMLPVWPQETKAAS